MKRQVGRHAGIDYRYQPMNEVFFVESRRWVWVTYQYGQPTGDTFSTKREMIAAINGGHFTGASNATETR